MVFDECTKRRILQYNRQGYSSRRIADLLKEEGVRVSYYGALGVATVVSNSREERLVTEKFLHQVQRFAPWTRTWQNGTERAKKQHGYRKKTGMDRPCFFKREPVEQPFYGTETRTPTVHVHTVHVRKTFPFSHRCTV